MEEQTHQWKNIGTDRQKWRKTGNKNLKIDRLPYYRETERKETDRLRDINNFGCRSATEILLTVLKIRNNCAFDEQVIRRKAVLMKRRFDEKSLHRQNGVKPGKEIGKSKQIN